AVAVVHSCRVRKRGQVGGELQQGRRRGHGQAQVNRWRVRPPVRAQHGRDRRQPEWRQELTRDWGRGNVGGSETYPDPNYPSPDRASEAQGTSEYSSTIAEVA